MEIKRIFNFAKANELIRMGNQVVQISPDKHDNTKLIFKFELTQKLIRDLEVINKVRSNR